MGTLGEGLGQLAIAESPGERFEGLRRQLACVSAILVERQVTPDEAARWPRPSRAVGAWVTGGVTQVDDQQHALSALLAARALRHGGAGLEPGGRG